MELNILNKQSHLQTLLLAWVETSWEATELVVSEVGSLEHSSQKLNSNNDYYLHVYSRRAKIGLLISCLLQTKAVKMKFGRTKVWQNVLSGLISIRTCNSG